MGAVVGVSRFQFREIEIFSLTHVSVSLVSAVSWVGPVFSPAAVGSSVPATLAGREPSEGGTLSVSSVSQGLCGSMGIPVSGGASAVAGGGAPVVPGASLIAMGSAAAAGI